MNTWHQEHEDSLSASERFADIVTTAIGSDLSIVLHTFLFVVCFIASGFGFIETDKMLLILTTGVSLEAIYLCLFLQKSSNMHGSRDRIQADMDYKTNREAKHEIEILQKAIYRLEEEKLDKILSILLSEPTETIH